MLNRVECKFISELTKRILNSFGIRYNLLILINKIVFVFIRLVGLLNLVFSITYINPHCNQIIIIFLNIIK